MFSWYTGVVKPQQVNARIESLGGVRLRQRGSHRIYQVTVDGVSALTTVAQHSRDIPAGTLAQIARDLEPVLGKGWLRR